MTPSKLDAAARSARERVQLAAAQRDSGLALEACDMLCALFDGGYRLFPLTDTAGTSARPVRLRARFDGLCASCGAPVAVDDPVVWVPGASGIRCAGCGAGMKAQGPT